MFIIGLSLVLTVVALIAASASIVGVKDKYGDLQETLKFKLRGRTLLGFLPLLLITITMYTSIPVNSVGVVFNQFNGLSNEVLNEGFHIKSPFDTVYVISTEVQTQTIDGLYVQTKTAQYLTLKLEVKYQITASNAISIFKKYRNIKAVNTDLLSSAALASASQITTTFNIMDILGEKRNDVQGQIKLTLASLLQENGVALVNMVLIDTDAGTAIEGAIEAEAIAKKAVETAMQAQARAEIEAQTKVLQAEAAAKVTLIEAQTAADANKLLSFSITPEILKKMEMEARIKWGWVTIQTGSAIVDTTP